MWLKKIRDLENEQIKLKLPAGLVLKHVGVDEFLHFAVRLKQKQQ
jgi:hypothetical protein